MSLPSRRSMNIILGAYLKQAVLGRDAVGFATLQERILFNERMRETIKSGHLVHRIQPVVSTALVYLCSPI